MTNFQIEIKTIDDSPCPVDELIEIAGVDYAPTIYYLLGSDAQFITFPTYAANNICSVKYFIQTDLEQYPHNFYEPFNYDSNFISIYSNDANDLGEHTLEVVAYVENGSD